MGHATPRFFGHECLLVVPKHEFRSDCNFHDCQGRVNATSTKIESNSEPISVTLEANDARGYEFKYTKLNNVHMLALPLIFFIFITQKAKRGRNWNFQSLTHSFLLLFFN